MTTNEIEVKLVLDQTQLAVPDLPDMVDIISDVCHSSDFESNVEDYVTNWIENSDLYYVPDNVDQNSARIEEHEERLDAHLQMVEDLSQMVEDLESTFQDRKDRLDVIEEKLGADDWSEEDNREISRLQDRVDALEHLTGRLENINKRLYYVISANIDVAPPASLEA